MAFDYLQKQAVDKTSTAEYTFEEIEGAPTIRVKPALEYNKPYHAELFKRTARLRRLVGRKKGAEGRRQVLSEMRRIDRELYPGFIIDGWDDDQGPYDKPISEGGQRIKYSPEIAADFIKALPDWIFDPCRDFCATVSNFAEVIEDPEELGNS